MSISENTLKTIDKIFDGNSILFVGSGFSLKAKDLKGDDLKSAKDLKESLYEQCGLDKSGPFHYAVDTFIDEFGEIELMRLMKDYFLVSEVQSHQKNIVKQNWRGIYTTNYDNVIETVLSDEHKQVRSTTAVSKPSQFTNKRNVIVHLNGFIEDVNEDKGIPEDFLLSDIDFVTSKFVGSDWYHHFKSDLITSDSVIFIGFSMQFDLDLSKVIFNTDAERREKIIFIVWEHEPPPNVKYLEKFGIVLKIGVEKFSKILAERQQIYVPKQVNSLRLFSFEEFKPTGNTRKITIDDVYNLLFFGKVDQDLIVSSIIHTSEYSYFINRSLMNQIINNVTTTKSNVVITSELGNGKSILLDGLKVNLHQRGYKIFHFRSWLDSTENEIHKICETYPECVFIIESYNHNIKAFDFLKTRASSNTVIITSERSAVHETTFLKLEKYFGENIFQYNIDRLTDEEIVKVIGLLDEYELWGEYSSLLKTEKERLIKTDCKSTLRILLLKLVKSKSLLDKFKEVIDSITGKRKYFEALVFILTANLFNIQIEIEEVISVLNYENFRNGTFAKDPAIRELIDFNSNHIKVKSSILSQVILSETSNAYNVVSAILKVCQQLDCWTDNYNYKSLLREYVSYSNISMIIRPTSQNYRDAIDYYFDELRNLKFCKGNPHFWLQFGIWNIEKGQLDLAKQHLDNAYAFAQKKKVETYQLDNQYARYLLLKIIEDDNVENLMKPFREAHRILTNNLSPNKVKYYPYKVAQNYVSIYDTFFNRLLSLEKKEFETYMREMVVSIEKYVIKAEDYRIKKYALKTLSELKERLK